MIVKEAENRFFKKCKMKPNSIKEITKNMR